MALITMAVNDTVENKRTEYTIKTLLSLSETVDYRKHRLVIIDNNSCEQTKAFLSECIRASEYIKVPTKVVENLLVHRHNPLRFIPVIPALQVITLPENIGTARAINQAWKLRKEGEHAIKMDNDVVIHSSGWVDEMEEAIRRDNKIGQIGLKRKDCWECTWHASDDFRSELKMLPQVPGERWIIVEEAKHIIGTCVMHSSNLLDKVGYLYQPSLYGYDDVLMSHRAHLAGFYSCFLPHIEIDHIDTGATAYQGWKERHSGEQTQAMIKLVYEMYNGIKPIYYAADY
jgi:GT2 family glycosyltransferase